MCLRGPAPSHPGSALTARGSELRPGCPTPEPARVRIRSGGHHLWGVDSRRKPMGSPHCPGNAGLGPITSSHGPAAHDVTRRESLWLRAAAARGKDGWRGPRRHVLRNGCVTRASCPLPWLSSRGPQRPPIHSLIWLATRGGCERWQMPTPHHMVPPQQPLACPRSRAACGSGSRCQPMCRAAQASRGTGAD